MLGQTIEVKDWMQKSCGVSCEEVAKIPRLQHLFDWMEIVISTACDMVCYVCGKALCELDFSSLPLQVPVKYDVS